MGEALVGVRLRQGAGQAGGDRRKSTSNPKADETTDTSERDAAIAAVLKENKDVAEELEGLTNGEKLIRLRQRGLIGFDVQ